MKRVAVLTSGGDAPGMNAAIRAVVRCGVAKGWEMYGIKNGYAGLIAGTIYQLGTRDVGGIIQKGGTMLGSARCEEFKTDEGRRKGIRILRQMGIDALVVIGGNGSQTGSNEIHKLGYPVVGIASTIDNDLYGSEMTIGVDTALNIALEAIDRLKTTASSHQRAFLIEVMGRDCGYLALAAGIAGGAEYILLPEIESDPEEVAETLNLAYEHGKEHAIIVVAEGAKYNAEALVQYFEKHKDRLGFKIRATILGHVQRGGEPGAFDRILASRFGCGAIEAIDREEYGVLVGLKNNKTATTPLEEVVANKKQISMEMVNLSRILD
ncbi:MAG TPA: 6-phosphofructokinase [Anaerolineaceae bacterium]|nr:6-phosphofructokinase [Anaerolineaceae bacterium]